MKLIIVESPNKIKKIQKFAGSDYKVMATCGAVMSYLKKCKYNQGVDVEDDCKLYRAVLKDKKKYVDPIKAEAKKATEIYLAGDADRVGESICRDVCTLCGLDPNTTKRLIFYEITKTAIQNALKSPTYINKDLCNAELARSALDITIGYQLSPVLWKYVQPNLSAGRVQSVAQRMVVEREKEIENFDSKPFYAVNGQFEHGKIKIAADLNKVIDDKQPTMDLLEKCKDAVFTIKDVKKTIRVQRPSPPFTTSSLQQTSSFSVKVTTSTAQKLFENSYITYPRTDSTNIPDENMDQIEEFVKTNYGEEFYNKTTYKTKIANSQEGHCAIIVTDVNKLNLDDDDNMTTYEKRLYDLIWKRTVASQMAYAKFNVCTLLIKISNSEKYHFISKAEKVKFEGFLKVYKIDKPDEDEEEENTNGKNSYTEFLKIKVGDTIVYISIVAKQKHTSPSSRYTEASLIKKLESEAIGRPSSYHTIITTIQTRNYVVKETRTFPAKPHEILTLSNGEISTEQKTEGTVTEKNKLFPTDIGVSVTDFLLEKFPTIMDYKFTANVEEKLDDISNGKIDWKTVLKDTYKEYNPIVEELLSTETISEKPNKLAESKFCRVLGEHKNKTVYVRIGKNSFVQMGESKPDIKYASLPKGQTFAKMTLEKAIKLLEWPKVIGQHEGKPVEVNKGEYGVYLKYDGKSYSIKTCESPEEVDLDMAISVIKEPTAKSKVIKEFNKKMKLINGQYGVCILCNGKFYPLSKEMEGKSTDEITAKEITEYTKNYVKKPFVKKCVQK